VLSGVVDVAVTFSFIWGPMMVDIATLPDLKASKYLFRDMNSYFVSSTFKGNGIRKLFIVASLQNVTAGGLG
jgi:hypothetical protein